MAGERTLPGLGLTGFWDLGDDGWKAANDDNLLTLSVLVQCRVLSIVAVEPGAPAQGDIHFLNETHATQANSLAVYDNAAWAYIAAFEGLELFNVTDNKRYRFDGATLVEIVAGEGGGGGGPLSVSSDASTDYTPALGDAEGYKQMTAATAVVYNVPDNATVAFPVGTRLFVEQNGAGVITFTPEAGVTVNSRGAVYASAGQWAVATLIKVAADTWLLSGDIA